ncbi:xyloglucan endotransglucosylase/hydrolase 14 [Striga asiatica]|uniref:Xyloglucan endotransglucosylase/hydrolase n=1 Tax=Striga asiatica TaxID=4170 RepID=A0A5A7QEG7_STRAF|nr:xyloglucan endotransglucosylase/hydrolase 14 [Striga asiatica]
MCNVMHFTLQKELYSLSFIFFFCIFTTIITTVTGFNNVTTLTFEDSYSPLFSKFNIQRSPDDRTVRLLLNRFSGSGIISSDYYNYGFFSASIKMPSEHTAGICVAFYTSNVDTFERNHDELDIEFLGNIKGRPWRFQTNMYGNGSVSRGREERYRMWFDPTKASHRYSILWTPRNIIFYVDDIPIREVVQNKDMRGDYPSKPMSVYATIWDASTWATGGGHDKVNYEYEPFVAEFKDLVLEGCVVDPTDQILSSNCTDSVSKLMSNEYAGIARRGRESMKSFREKYMYYSYCYDNLRYAEPPPECVIVPSEREMFKTSGRLREKMKFHGSHHGRHRRGRSRRRSKEGSTM